MIYFIRSYNKAIKIGRSLDPQKRLKELQTGSHFKLYLKQTMPGDSQTEAGLHEMFSHIRIHGEWFRYTDELKWFIRTVQANPDIHNIKTIYILSQKSRLLEKSKRLGNKSNISKGISKILNK